MLRAIGKRFRKDRTAGCEKVVGIRFALDSSLEGDGFELSVPVKKSQFLEMVCADFFRHFPSERDPIRLPLPVEMSQQGTQEL